MTKPTKGSNEKKARLFVGTTEQIAKETPIKGISPSVVLTDVYPGYFASVASKGKWGIIEVNVEALLPDNLAAWHGDSWEESLKKNGACLYLLRIPPIAIAKVSIYNPLGGNTFVNDAVSDINPLKITKEKHRDLYALNQGLTRWLVCEEVAGEELLNGENCPAKATKLDLALQNRNGLELFYRRTENFHAWWKAEGI